MKQTPNYNLPQFEGLDKFTKEDFNDAFSKIDLGISDMQEIINNANGGNLIITQEVIGARKGEESLPIKIDKIDESILVIESEIVQSRKIEGELSEKINKIDENVTKVNSSLETKAEKEALNNLESTSVAKSDFVGNLISNGWRKNPDGFIEQWGYTTIVGVTGGIWASVQVTFPIQFSENCFSVHTEVYAAGVYGSTNNGYTTKTGATIYYKPETNGDITLLWKAIGV